MSLWSFLTLPFGLPINPILSFFGMMVIEAIGLSMAYRLTGEIGGSSGEMTIIHWILRAIIFVFLWAFVCGIIYVIRFVANYWLYVLIGIGVIALIAIGIFVLKKRRGKKNARNEG